jgi:CRP/FNR family transcriptional regulator, cyclic AMP receptor protein
MFIPVQNWVLEDFVENERKQAALFEDAAEEGKVRLEFAQKLKIFHQSEPADSVFYLRQGTVKLSVISKEGKQAIISILGPGEFFGEECLAGRQLRIATATTVTQMHPH